MNLRYNIFIIIFIIITGCGENENQSQKGIVIFADSNGSLGADGSFYSPMTLNSAIAANADVIVLLSTDGDILGNYRLLENQWLIGAGDNGKITALLPWGENLTLTNLGTRPKIVGEIINNASSQSRTLDLSNNNRVEGIEISGGLTGLYANSNRISSPGDFIINDLIIRDSHYYGIHVVNCNNAIINSVDIHEIQIWSGVLVDTCNDVNINNVATTTTGQSGINKTKNGIEVLNSTTVVLDNININDSDSKSLNISGALAIDLSNVTIGGSLSDAITLDGIIILMDNITVQSAGDNGIFLDGADISANNLNITNVGTGGTTPNGGIVITNLYSGASSIFNLSNSYIDSADAGIALVAHYGMSVSGIGNIINNVNRKCDLTGNQTISGSIQLTQGTCP